MPAHEYSIVGHSRARIGLWLGIAAAAIAAGLTVLAADLAGPHGRGGWLPQIVLLPVAAALIYAIAFRAFGLKGWKSTALRRLLNVPDLGGEWEVAGETHAKDGTVSDKWTGTLSVEQSWDKIKVTLRTANAPLESIAASIICDPARGYILLFSYRLDARSGVTDPNHRLGYCELKFNGALTSAYGQQFNNMDRSTFARLTLARKRQGRGR